MEDHPTDKLAGPATAEPYAVEAATRVTNITADDEPDTVIIPIEGADDEPTSIFEPTESTPQHERDARRTASYVGAGLLLAVAVSSATVTGIEAARAHNAHKDADRGHFAGTLLTEADKPDRAAVWNAWGDKLQAVGDAAEINAARALTAFSVSALGSIVLITSAGTFRRRS